MARRGEVGAAPPARARARTAWALGAVLGGAAGGYQVVGKAERVAVQMCWYGSQRIQMCVYVCVSDVNHSGYKD